MEFLEIPTYNSPSPFQNNNETAFSRLRMPAAAVTEFYRSMQMQYGGASSEPASAKS